MKILIVDDEPGLASGLAGWLTDNGWGEPGVAQSGDEAIEWINAQGGINVLVTDVVMEPTDGLTLRESIQASFPKLKTIFISGYDLSEHADRMSGALFLPKPVTGEMLDEAIRKLFEPAAPAPIAAPTVPVAAPTATPIAAATPRVTPVTVSHAGPKAVAASSGPVVRATASAPRAAAVAAQPKAAAVAATAAPRAAVAGPKAVSAAPGSVSAGLPSARSTAPKSAEIDPRDVEVELPPDEFVGTTVGEYNIEARIGQGSSGGIYRALQTNIGRTVRLYLLDPERAAQPGAVKSFIDNASMKANVAHPYIFAVYEAGEVQGVHFYSCEYVPCRSLRQFREAGDSLNEGTAAQIMKAVAEVLGYFYQKQIPHNLITENAILLAAKNKPRIANIAAHEITRPFTSEEEMAALGAIIGSALGNNPSTLGLRDLTTGLADGTQTFANWPAFIKAINDCVPKVAPEDAFKLDAQERAAIRMVEEAKKKQKRGMLMGTVVSLTLVVILLGVTYWALGRAGILGSKKGKDFTKVITIPAGEFIYQDGQKVTLPAYDIDQYEVTIAQYALFLEYLKEHPEDAIKFDHPDQPKDKPHVPKDWADQQLATGPMYGYYTRANRWGKFKDAALSVDAPVFGVDWFDAFAYAKWKGRRLPTEQEWEKAGRGTEGFKYPWGNDEIPTNTNTGIDTSRDPAKGGEKDGFDASAPVDELPKDKSPFGVMNMAGNVSEWTSSMDEDPMMPGKKVPVIRGGNWNVPDHILTRRIVKIMDLESNEALGFRTVGDQPPAK